MKITKVESYPVWGGHRNFLFVVVETDEGIFGGGLNVSFTGVESFQSDGAEGNDRFFVLGTSQSLETIISGGLGSDSFVIGGDTPSVISNDTKPSQPSKGFSIRVSGSPPT